MVLGLPWKLRKFFTDCLQNLAQCFIWIQEYFNKINLKKEWSSGAPKILKSSILIAFKFGDKVLFECRSVYNIKKYKDGECLSSLLWTPKILKLQKFFTDYF